MEILKNWHHFWVKNAGMVELRIDGETVDGAFEIGLIETGRQRVFHCYFVKVDFGGRHWIGTDQWSVRSALEKLATTLAGEGIELKCAGLSGNWYETGLSENSGYGYIDEVDRRVFIMELVREVSSIQSNFTNPPISGS